MGIRGEVLLDRPPVFTFMLKGMSTEIILEPSVTYWTSDDLARLGFSRSVVTARTLNLAYPDPAGRGPFCRLDVEANVQAAPGVYGWVVDREVAYIGMSRALRQIVHGAGMSRANNDYTYMAPSKVVHTSSPRVFVNGRLNAAIQAGIDITWWWLMLSTEQEALRTEARLLRTLPPWNKQQPRWRWDGLASQRVAIYRISPGATGTAPGASVSAFDVSATTQRCSG